MQGKVNILLKRKKSQYPQSLSSELRRQTKCYELVMIKFEGGFVSSPISIDYESISYKLSQLDQ